LIKAAFVISQKFLLLVSGLSRFIAGLGANFEFDLKRIIALFTWRHLGLTIMIISIFLSSLAFSIY
jgi:NADH-ubiquinone oxidoreductase chain 5